MTQQDKMSNSLDKLDAILHRMETERIANKEHFQMYKETIDRSMEFHEKRWNNLRSSVIVVVGFFVVSVFTGAVSLSKKIEMSDVEAMDYATKTDVVRGDQFVIEGIMDIVSDELDISDFDNYNMSHELMKEVYKSVTGEVSRSIE